MIRESWSYETPGPGDHVAPLPDAAVEQVGDKPQFSAEDLALINPAVEVEEVAAAPASAPAGAEPLADVDPEDLAGWRRQLKEGLRTTEELQRAYNLTDGELEAVTNPPKPMTRARIERELAEISALRRAEPRAYWRDEAMQQKERDLLAAREKVKAEPASAENQKPEGLDEIEAELEKIAQTRRNDPQAYRKDEALQARERELIEAREAANEGARQEAQLRSTVDAVRDSAADAGAIEASFDRMFGSLSADGQDVLRWHLRQPPPDPARGTSDVDLQGFASIDEHLAKLVSRWGRDAPKKHAIANARLAAIYDGMDDEDVAAAQAWMRGLSGADKAAIVEALAGAAP